VLSIFDPNDWIKDIAVNVVIRTDSNVMCMDDDYRHVALAKAIDLPREKQHHTDVVTL
jgi:hypothetical protein